MPKRRTMLLAGLALLLATTATLGGDWSMVPAASVEIEKMKGKDGKPVLVQHLSSADNYVQYVSKTNSHANDKDGFDYSGTNGFTATIKAQGSTE